MIITKEKYKEILDIQGVPYTENSKWFETSLERINQALSIANVVVTLPSVNSKEFKDWLKSEGYKNKGFGIYQKENKDYCYKLLYKDYCNVLEFGN